MTRVMNKGKDQKCFENREKFVSSLFEIHACGRQVCDQKSAKSFSTI
jgi:hypothetical protein